MAVEERQILHVAMDAFYASIEIRDNPWLRGQSVIVGGMSDRGAVCAVSREAADYGLYPGMPSKTARRLCPGAVFLRTRINHYKEVSRQIRRILDDHTDLIEPVGLDEWYLDVTHNKQGLATGFDVAREAKKAIRERLALTASAGVAPCKFLAKIASDREMPDGLVVVSPGDAQSFLAPLPVTVIPGVGEGERRRLSGMGAQTVAELAEIPRGVLEQSFGNWGVRLYEYARGIDPRPISPDKEYKSLNRDQTFEAATTDLARIRHALAGQAETLARRLEAKGVQARTVTLRIQYADFSHATRSVTHDSYFRSESILRDQAMELLRRSKAGSKPIRLVGLAVSHFWEDDQATQLSLIDLAEPEYSA